MENNVVNKLKKGDVEILCENTIIIYSDIKKVEVKYLNNLFFGYNLIFKDNAQLFLSKEVKFIANCPIAGY